MIKMNPYSLNLPGARIETVSWPPAVAVSWPPAVAVSWPPAVVVVVVVGHVSKQSCFGKR